MRPGCMASAALLADLVAQLAQRMHHPALQPALRQPCQYERDADGNTAGQPGAPLRARQHGTIGIDADVPGAVAGVQARGLQAGHSRWEEQTAEHQSLMRISNAVL